MAKRRDDIRVEMIGHASLRVHFGGKTILTDPWYTDPINCNAIYHWPPLVHSIQELGETTDAIYITHIHPDHFDPLTLKQFPRHIPVYIGDYKEKYFRDEIALLGFKVFEVPFQTRKKVAGTDFVITIIESDYAESAAFDSSCVIETPEFTVFDNNDCFLKNHKYEWVRDNYKVDYGFLGFSHASFYPICFEFEPSEKKKLLDDNAERRYNDFTNVAQILRPRVAIPFAMGIRFLHDSMLWQNISFNSPHEAVRRANALGLNSEILWPGDAILKSDEVLRHGKVYREENEEQDIRETATLNKDWINSLWAKETPAAPNIVERFKEYVTSLWIKTKDQYPQVRENIIAYKIEGPSGGEFYFDFSRPEKDVFVQGAPPRFDMRYTYPDKILQLRLDRKIDWDELNFSNRVSVKQVKYAPAYYAMIRSPEGL